VPEPEGWLPKLQFTKDDVMNVIELGAMTFLGLIVLFTVVRPLVRKVLTAEPAPSTSLVVQDGAPVAATSPGTNPPQISAAKLIDVAQVQGQVHAQSVHRVGELAEKNPHETVSIIRQWLSEPAPT
jgi:flagellar M-ring protein FliF